MTPQINLLDLPNQTYKYKIASFYDDQSYEIHSDQELIEFLIKIQERGHSICDYFIDEPCNSKIKHSDILIELANTLSKNSEELRYLFKLEIELTNIFEMLETSKSLEIININSYILSLKEKFNEQLEIFKNLKNKFPNLHTMYGYENFKPFVL